MNERHVVHPNVDLDAVSCIGILGALPEEVFFLPAGAKELPVELKSARVVDHPLGEKGRLDADGVRHAALLSLPEAKDCDPQLLAEVDEQDSTGRVLQPRFSLARILAALRQEGHGRGLKDEALDRELIRVMGRVVRGINSLWANRKAAEEVISRSRIEEVAGAKLAVFPDGLETSPEAGILLAERGIAGSIYRQGFNLGVTRYPGYTKPDFRKLGPKLPGWFVHPTGFLACWGSRKSPETRPPPTGTPQTQEELLELLRAVL